MNEPVVARCKRLGFSSTDARHKWIQEHKDEILQFYNERGTQQTMMHFHVSGHTVRDLIKAQVGHHKLTESKEEAKRPEAGEMLFQRAVFSADYFIDALQNVINSYKIARERARELTTRLEALEATYHALLVKNEKLQSLIDSWERIAGQLKDNMEKMVRREV